MLLYSLLLSCGLLLASPWWIVRLLTTQRYREGMIQRLGHVPSALRQTVAGRRVLWLHAVSVGETLAAQRLVAELDASLGEEWRVVISTTTRTGQELACERFGGDRVFYMPLDFAFSVRSYLRALKPEAIVLMESELWPRLLHEAKRRTIPCIVANARVSDRSFRRAQKFNWLWKHVLAKVTLFLAQSDEDARRLQQLGARRVQVAGNMKFDVRAPKQSPLLERIRQEAAGRPVLVAGSLVEENGAHRTEDEMVISAWVATTQAGHDALLILAPRHPENFKRAEAFARPFRYLRASDGQREPDSSFPGKGEGPLEILILDTIGDLASVYSLATAAFVGGSLVSRGGHNPLEPAQFAVPVAMGNSYENFRSMVTLLNEAQGIELIEDETQLAAIWQRWLEDPAQAQRTGQRAAEVFAKESGATQRIVDAVRKELKS